jgi:hypothetical protein
MSSRKYVGPAEICWPKKKNFGGAAPEPPRGGLRPPLTPLRTRRKRSDTTTCAKNITHTQHYARISCSYVGLGCSYVEHREESHPIYEGSWNYTCAGYARSIDL